MSENTKNGVCQYDWRPWTLCNGNPKLIRDWRRPVKLDRRAEREYVAAAHSTPAGAEIKFARPTVFPSLCDWLDDEVPIEWLARFLKLIHDTPNLTWLLLTKRPENWRPRLDAVWKADHHHDWPGEEHEGSHTHWLRLWLHNQSQMQPPSNVWIGTSVEDQANADRRIPELLKIPAAGRFLSLEPLLGPVDLNLRGRSTGFPKHIRADGSAVGLPIGLHWLIIGGESGPGARPCNVEWIRGLVAQGRTAGVPTFVKQLGARPILNPCRQHHFDWRHNTSNAERPDDKLFAEDGEHWRIILNHPKGGDPAEWRDDLRVREFPEGLQ